MTFDQYKNTALIEYPRLCAELLKMTENVVQKIQGAQITSVVPKKLPLSAHDNNILKSIGVVDVSDWKVVASKGSIAFIPDGLSIGVTARIRIETLAKNAFYKGCIFTAETTQDPNKWRLVTLDKSLTAHPLTESELLNALRSML